MQHGTENNLGNNQGLWKTSSTLSQNHIDSLFFPNNDVTNSIIELNVGGVVYTTSRGTLTSEPNSLICELFAPKKLSSVISHAKENFFQQPPGNISEAANKFNSVYPLKSRSPTPCAEPKHNQFALQSPPEQTVSLPRDSRGRYFIDRDGVLFRFVLDYLRNGKLILPDCFLETSRLRQEAEFYRLNGLMDQLNSFTSTTPSFNTNYSPSSEDQQTLTTLPHQNQQHAVAPITYSNRMGQETITRPRVSPAPLRDPGFIVVGYRGTFAFGRDGCQADVKFRKMWRILICGRVSLCREVFKDSLNESRDVDRGTTDRYTSRFFLKHTFLEQAFDMLQETGFKMVASCGSGTNSAGGDLKPGMDLEESKWNHYNEFVFCRE